MSECNVFKPDRSSTVDQWHRKDAAEQQINGAAQVTRSHIQSWLEVADGAADWGGCWHPLQVVMVVDAWRWMWLMERVAVSLLSVFIVPLLALRQQTTVREMCGWCSSPVEMCCLLVEMCVFEHISLTIWRRRGRQSHLGGPYERVRGARWDMSEQRGFMIDRQSCHSKTFIVW